MKKLNNRAANAIIWAAMILATAIMVDGDGGSATSSTSFMLVMIHIAGWFVTDQLVREKNKDGTPC